MIDYIRKLLKSMSGLKIGDLDIGDKVLDHEFRVRFLFKLFEWLINNNPTTLPNRPSPEDLKQIREEIIGQLKKEYPTAGIEFKEK